MVKLVIFDFDGTLADTSDLICQSYSAATEGTVVERPPEAFLKYLGRPLSHVYLDLHEENPKLDMVQEVFLKRYRARYHGLGYGATSLYDGVAELLPELAKTRDLAVATTKTSENLRRHAGHFGIIPHFAHLQGTDNFCHKPHPEVLNRVLKATGHNPGDAVFIGDTTMDILAGQRAGIRTVGVSYGGHGKARLEKAGADHIIDHISELRDLL